MKTSDRLLWIDYLRFIACFFVIMVHVPEIGSGIYEKVYTYISRIAVPIFFMMSGFLTLPYNGNLRQLFKKRLTRLFFPFLFWSIIYAIIPYFYSEIDVIGMVRKVFYIPLKLTAPHLWYMYSIIGLTLITPIISPWLKIASNKQLLFFLAIWLVTLFFPYLQLIDLDIEMNEWNSIYTLYYFSGYLGYFVLGFYLKKIIIETSQVKYFISFLSIILFSFFIVFTLTKYTQATIEITRYLTINIALFSIGVFMIFKRLPFSIKRLDAIVLSVSKTSFGIYLGHELILRRLVMPFFNLDPFFNVFSRPVITFITLLITYLIILGISKLPYSKYLIG
ncbi:acyltransferase [Winogradskyella pacifica]|uniref:acyltransferase n=1 Tax=Winogradskyella pacifica TaxID=664642 RepID=UPI0015C75AFC|nr:acyltransferase family protein [Winogradskyella pacifica]